MAGYTLGANEAKMMTGNKVCIVSLFLLFVLYLAACSSVPSATTNSSPTATQPAIVARGNFQEYALPQPNDGLMRPAIDQQGRIWFGEMSRDRLADFDPHTRAFQQITPPRGQSGIMGIAVAADDSIWFAEQYANYIGHYFPTTEKFSVYSLPKFTTPDPSNAHKTLSLPDAPNDVAVDTHGSVWFTEINAGAVGELNPRTGHITQYSLSTDSAKAQQIDPYGITVDPRGMIWFTEVDGNRIGRLDPGSGAITYYSQAHLTTSPMEIASDQHGTLWITSFVNSLLLSLNPRTGGFTAWYAPRGHSEAGILYGVTVDRQGNIWVTLSAQNAVAQLNVATKRFVYYIIPTTDSLPLGIVSGADHTLWFTEAGSNKIGMLQA